MKLYRTILFAPRKQGENARQSGQGRGRRRRLDLEDAVPADEKTATGVRSGRPVKTIVEEDGADVFVRVNPLDDVTGFSIACGRRTSPPSWVPRSGYRAPQGGERRPDTGCRPPSSRCGKKGGL